MHNQGSWAPNLSHLKIGWVGGRLLQAGDETSIK